MSDEESGVSPIPAASYGTTVDQSSDHGELSHTVHYSIKRVIFFADFPLSLSNALIKSN